jgi:hypothetical protein
MRSEGSTAVNINVTVFREVTQNSLVNRYHVSEETAVSFFRVEYGGSRFLRNDGTYLPNNMAYTQ